MSSLQKQNVNSDEAEKIFRKAFSLSTSTDFVLQSLWDKEISEIINGSHLTYRYLLVTALLAKATNEKVNTLALQAKSSLSGAYDARSLFHSVIVPLERELMARALGGSNEPYLNKPARYQEISRNNPVRRGKDKRTLETLIKVLSNINTKEIAFKGLCSALYCAIQKAGVMTSELTRLELDSSNQFEILEFVKDFITSSIEGQTSPLMVGVVLSIFLEQINAEFDVIVHPVNQSGASSKEVSDVDIKKLDSIFTAIEIKDKLFTDSDVEHAAFKAKKYNLPVIIFAKGPNGNYRGESLKTLADKIEEKEGIKVIFIEVKVLLLNVLAFCNQVTSEQFFSKLKYYAEAARVKDDVFSHIENLIQKHSCVVDDD